jgi:flagellum-specific peptidoglycan hydrolase FlgJ
MNIRHWDLVYAQAYLETGGFKSKIFLQNNNLFGMKVAGSRPTTAMYEDRGHAVYVDWRSSVVDYAMYYSKYLSRYISRSSYLEYLGANYAEDKNYVKKLLKIKV